MVLIAGMRLPYLTDSQIISQLYQYQRSHLSVLPQDSTCRETNASSSFRRHVDSGRCWKKETPSQSLRIWASPNDSQMFSTTLLKQKIASTLQTPKIIDEQIQCSVAQAIDLFLSIRVSAFHFHTTIDRNGKL